MDIISEDYLRFGLNMNTAPQVSSHIQNAYTRTLERFDPFREKRKKFHGIEDIDYWNYEDIDIFGEFYILYSSHLASASNLLSQNNDFFVAFDSATPDLLLVDFACGAGAASAAILNHILYRQAKQLPVPARIDLIGFDH